MWHARSDRTLYWFNPCCIQAQQLEATTSSIRKLSEAAQQRAAEARGSGVFKLQRVLNEEKSRLDENSRQLVVMSDETQRRLLEDMQLEDDAWRDAANADAERRMSDLKSRLSAAVQSLESASSECQHRLQQHWDGEQTRLRRAMEEAQTHTDARVLAAERDLNAVIEEGRSSGVFGESDVDLAKAIGEARRASMEQRMQTFSKLLLEQIKARRSQALGNAKKM